MKTKSLQVKTQMEIAKPVHQVFEAIVDPEKMSHFFISSGTGRMQGGKTVHWKFDKGGGLDARVERTEPDRFVSFVWSASGIEAIVAILAIAKEKPALLLQRRAVRVVRPRLSIG